MVGDEVQSAMLSAHSPSLGDSDALGLQRLGETSLPWCPSGTPTLCHTHETRGGAGRGMHGLFEWLRKAWLVRT